MKPNELIKILDSGVVKELTIYYCGGHITVEKDSCPFELPDYTICKLWNSENGRGISVLLADGIAAEREPVPDDLAAEPAAEWIKNVYEDGGYNYSCPFCSGKTTETTEFCPHCGKRIKGGET